MAQEQGIRKNIKANEDTDECEGLKKNVRLEEIIFKMTQGRKRVQRIIGKM